MLKKEKIIIVFVIVSAVVFGGYTVRAASSGCYRWHSCPSVSGSYICGDTGHCSQCPNNQYCQGGLPLGTSTGAINVNTNDQTPPIMNANLPSAVMPVPVITPIPANPVLVPQIFVPPKQSKLIGCVAKNGLQDVGCSPGAVLNVTAAQVCKSGYSKSVRNVTTKTKNQVYAEYGIKKHVTGQYEVDHLISLELGGSNDISNLWPEAAKPSPGFHEKDKVENWLHAKVCKGTMTLNEAQREISTNWLTAYSAMSAAVKNVKVNCVDGCQ
jgi:hypothetical protein